MMPLNNASAAFEKRYASHLKHLKLQGLQTKTMDAYARAIRTMGEHFDWQIDTLSEDQLTGYFHQRIASHSWSAVKLDLYGYKFYVVHVLRQPWAMPRHIGKTLLASTTSQISILPARRAFASMNSRRGSTSSPISIVNTRSASIASSICTRNNLRTVGSIVVSHNCIGFISPSPL